MQRGTRLCSIVFGVLTTFALAQSAGAQIATAATDAQVRVIDGSGQLLPPGTLQVRAADGHVVLGELMPGGGQYIFRNVGRKVTFEFTMRGLKQSDYHVLLLDYPVVAVTVMADPETGRIKEIAQKAVLPAGGGKKMRMDMPGGRGQQAASAVPPTNDACLTPLPAFVGLNAFTTVDATTDGPLPGGCGSVHKDVWFTWLATATGTATFSTCPATGGASTTGFSSGDTKIAVYSGTGCPVGAFVGCDDDACATPTFSSVALAPVTSGTTYLIRLGGFSAGTGTGSGTFAIIPPAAAPANDMCAGAISVSCGSSTTFNNSAATATGDPAYSCIFGGPGPGVGNMWYSFTPASNGTATLDTESSAVSDTVMAVYTGTCGSLTEVACSDDEGAGLLSLLSLPVTGGTTYLVQVGSFSAASQGSITLDVTCVAGVPQGDTCDDPFLGSCDSTTSFNNVAFGTDVDDPLYSCAFFGPQQGVGTGWVKFTATDTSARIDTEGSTAFDTLLAVYDGSCGSLVELCCDDDSGTGLLSSLCCEGLTVGNTYYIQASAFSALDVGDINVNIECPCPLPPTNDDCADAVAVGALPTSIVVNNTLATTDAIAAPCGVFSGPFNNVWYTVVGTGNTLSATTCNAGTLNPDTKISVFCGDCLAPICVAGNDDDCPAGGPIFASTVAWCSQPGVTYLLTVGNFSSSDTGGVIQLDISDDGAGCDPDVQCLPTGACCLSDGSCVTLSGGDCATAGGTYNGDGSICSSNAVLDPSFEAGAFGGVWTEFSSTFGTPLCDAGCGFGGGTGPNTGSWWAWFGGIAAFEEGLVEQAVVIPVSASTLDFALEIPVVSGNGTDFLEVLIDGFVVDFYDTTDGPFVGYTNVSVPLGGFADGGVHLVSFHSIVTALTNFFVDDVAINSQVTSCIECITLDFTASNEGPLAHGQDLETPGETFDCVTISGGPIGGGPLGNAGAAIFDSTGGPAGQDPDLMVGQGNILILQNNENAQVLTKSGDFYAHPNDDHDGGTLTFTFCEPADATTIDLIDIDDANGPGFPDGATVVLTDVNGFTHTITVPDGWTANGGVGVLDLKTLANQTGVSGDATASEQVGYDNTSVVSIAVTLESSGAVDNLEFCH
jgi:hypothetical protein